MLTASESTSARVFVCSNCRFSVSGLAVLGSCLSCAFAIGTTIRQTIVKRASDGIQRLNMTYSSERHRNIIDAEEPLYYRRIKSGVLAVFSVLTLAQLGYSSE